ncbi:aminopeptidase P family N-terminal domain-containing protein [Planctomonas sp. JC2975]|uniref:aminopeptidase P family N-terminal domain-containing protein n=1 Tax=Planctomonas sp. JC2975 TaxID=2729626 RepID=UPI001F0F12FE|nr:aminopeptidase P family N-terminal domain-containing protein [Planctomonas sp. JC2975]
MAEDRFSTAVYLSRLQRAVELVRENGLDAVIVTPGPDLQYLVGSRASTFERLTALVLPADGDPFVVAPRMELAALRASAVGEAGLDVRDWVDGQDPYALALRGLGITQRIGVSEATPALHTVPLAVTSDAAIELATPVLRSLRMVKDAAEIAALREAGAAIDRVHASGSGLDAPSARWLPTSPRRSWRRATRWRTS